jgi:TolA-binding protein
MITEKSSRDWIMRSEPNRVQPTPAKAEEPTQPNNTDVTPPLSKVIAPSEMLTPVTKTVTRPEVKKVVEPELVNASAPPENVLRIEQQQATIARLENEVSKAQERLKREQLENEARITEERRAADVARQAQLKKIEELQNNASVESVRAPVKAPEQAIPSNTPPSAASVQTVSVTTGREQTLYRSAVTAYKIGDCTESVRAFDAFSKAYPNSPFSSDAAYYRKDCADRLAASAAR